MRNKGLSSHNESFDCRLEAHIAGGLDHPLDYDTGIFAKSFLAAERSGWFASSVLVSWAEFWCSPVTVRSIRLTNMYGTGQIPQ